MGGFLEGAHLKTWFLLQLNNRKEVRRAPAWLLLCEAASDRLITHASNVLSNFLLRKKKKKKAGSWRKTHCGTVGVFTGNRLTVRTVRSVAT